MTLLVMGASSDMGMSFIKSTYKNYDKIIAHYRTMSEELKTLGMEIGVNRITFLQADLLEEEEVLSLIEKIKEVCNYPSHIVHFPAPLCENNKFHKIGWKVFQEEYDISVKSIVLVLQAFLPMMAKEKYGRVVLMLSYVVNNVAPAYCCNYVVTKYAMLGLMKALATEYAPRGITVNGISPAWVNTKYIDKQPDFLKEQNAKNSPIGRNLEVNEIAPTIEYLLSEGGSCINGENITISCGR